MINYNFTEKDFKKYLMEKRKIPSLFFLLFGTVIYFYLTFYLLFDSFVTVIVFYLLYIILFTAIIYLLNNLYCFIVINGNKKNNLFGNYKIKISEDRIIINTNNQEKIYLKSDIRKIKKNKKYILIYYKKNIYLLLLKDKLNDNYNKIIANIK